MRSLLVLFVLLSILAWSNLTLAAGLCPPPTPLGGGDYVDDCREVLRVECPEQGQVLTGFKAQVDGLSGIITALHGVVGCGELVAFNAADSYRNLRIARVDIGMDAAFLTSEATTNGTGLQSTSGYEEQALRVVGYPQALDYQFSHRVELQMPPLRQLFTTVPEWVRADLERRGSPHIDQTVMSLSGAIQNGYSGAPILTWEGRVVGVANGGLKEGSVDIGWAMPIWQLQWQDARLVETELAALSGGRPSALFGANASAPATLPVYYLADGGNPIGRIYEARDGRLREIYRRESGRLYSVAVAPNGIFYFSNANDNHVYRLKGKTEIKVFTHTTYTRDVEFDFQGRLYFSESTGAGGDGVIYRLDGNRATPYYRVRLKDVGGFWAGNFAFDSAGVLWLSNGNKNPASLYKVVNSKPRRMFNSGGSISGFAFTRDGELLYADWRQTVSRLELPGFFASEVLRDDKIKWASDVSFAINGAGTKPKLKLKLPAIEKIAPGTKKKLKTVPQ